MNITSTPLTDIPQFSSRDKAYISAESRLKPFYKYEVDFDAFSQLISDKANHEVDRSVLVETLKAQYSRLDTHNDVLNNIDALSNKNTFTIVTAHQPSLLTGPGYYFYKILSAIRLTQLLSSRYAHLTFVPIFITGGEDHDFEEVNHLNLFGKEIIWQTNQKGSVGQFKLDEGFEEAFDTFKQILGSSESAEKFKEAVSTMATSSETYGEFAVGLSNYLFKSFGLVVLDMSSSALKKTFIPIIKKEIFENISHRIVSATQVELAEIDWKSQAMVREINFFYTGSGDRLRIDRSGDDFIAIDSDIEWTRTELEKEIEDHPERFSPNVVMRPIYQEFCLPNLAYIGGGGEIAYWLERKDQFDAFEVPFPMLIRRNSGLYLDGGSRKKMNKLNLQLPDLFQRTDDVINQYLKTRSGENLDFDSELSLISKQFDILADKAASVDPNLKKKILAEGTKLIKQVEQLTSRIHRAAKSNEETSVNQIRKIKDKLFPGEGLQERKSSFLDFYVKYGKDGLKEILPYFNPLEKSMVIISD